MGSRVYWLRGRVSRSYERGHWGHRRGQREAGVAPTGGVDWRLASGEAEDRVRRCGMGCQEATSPRIQSMAAPRRGQGAQEPACVRLLSCDLRTAGDAGIGGGRQALQQTDGAGRSVRYTRQAKSVLFCPSSLEACVNEVARSPFYCLLVTVVMYGADRSIVLFRFSQVDELDLAKKFQPPLQSKYIFVSEVLNLEGLF